MHGITMYSTHSSCCLQSMLLPQGLAKLQRDFTCTPGDVQRDTRSFQTAPEAGWGRMKPTLAHHHLFAVERQGGEWPQKCLQKGMEQDFRRICTEDLPFLWDKEVNHLVTPCQRSAWEISESKSSLFIFLGRAPSVTLIKGTEREIQLHKKLWHLF